MAHLAISATAHGLNYLPEYYADHAGLFADRGLTVTAKACDPWTGVLDDLASGAADVALGGIWVPGMYHGTPRELTVFTQLNHQFPKALVTRTTSDRTFTWSSLHGAVVLAPGIGGSAPYAITAGMMRESGVDPADTTFLRDLSTPMFVELFESGLGDAIILDITTAQSMSDRGTGCIAVEYAKVGGLGPNSVYYCRSDRFDELQDRLVDFTSALGEAMAAVNQAPVAELEPLLVEHWPSMSPATLSAACGRIQSSRTWETPRIDPAATDRWMRILAEESMVHTAPSFDDIVDTRIIDSIEMAVGGTR
ncbi:ABC transporter substrate-binding protein [Williamsia sterculiae]|uniref:NitT/TauT family transport system substrate-binding protein n=1 Tax=Williamsia sterculiae TaxID=1344003 RepID=A0A1N7H188_9NOCA|nr:ABC transporter substrate-binding protein [Williamsia sterculiae]SIS18592.1 NitT/TauT family transport system substrate-binding protein [Williamsia sterculiae]